MHETDPMTETQPWWKSRLVALAALALLVCMGAALRVSALDGVRRRTPDERVYTAAGQVLLTQGGTGMKVLRARAAEDTTTAATPVRAGYLFLLAETMRLTGLSDERAGAGLACVLSIATMLLLALVAWRRFSPAVALTAVVLDAVSPAALMTARRSWEEAVTEAVTMVLILAASEITAGSRRVVWGVIFALTGAFAITVKQTAAIAFALCAAWVLAVLVLRGERRNALRCTAVCAVASLAAVSWLVSQAGDWSHFMALLANNTNSLEGSAYSIAYEAGSPWQLMQAFAIVSVPTLVLVLAALTYACDLRRPVPVQRQIVIALFGIVAVFLGLVTLLPHHMNLRYLAPLFAPAALLAGVGMAFLLDLRRFVGPEQSGLLGALAVLALIVMAAVDYHHFRTEFAAPDLQDLSLRMVLAAGDEPLPANAPAAAVPPAGLADWLALSVRASQAGDCQATVDAAQHAVQVDANSALAWNDLAAGFECAHQWPAAIDAAQHALKLQPDLQLARNNLNWSLEQQRKALSEPDKRSFHRLPVH